MKDTIRAIIAKRVQNKLLELDHGPISGTSTVPGCGSCEIIGGSLEVSVINKNYTSIRIGTPGGSRYFTVRLQESYI